MRLGVAIFAVARVGGVHNCGVLRARVAGGASMYVLWLVVRWVSTAVVHGCGWFGWCVNASTPLHAMWLGVAIFAVAHLGGVHDTGVLRVCVAGGASTPLCLFMPCGLVWRSLLLHVLVASKIAASCELKRVVRS